MLVAWGGGSTAVLLLQNSTAPGGAPLQSRGQRQWRRVPPFRCAHGFHREFLPSDVVSEKAPPTIRADLISPRPALEAATGAVARSRLLNRDTRVAPALVRE